MQQKPLGGEKSKDFHQISESEYRRPDVQRQFHHYPSLESMHAILTIKHSWPYWVILLAGTN